MILQLQVPGYLPRSLAPCTGSLPCDHRAIERRKDSLARRTRPGPRKELACNIWEDVTVRIYKARGHLGKEITNEDLDEWAAVAIDLVDLGPTIIIRTDHGDLILDERFWGQLYFKGLRLPNDSHCGKTYVFAYNFVNGNPNRDRGWMMDPLEEAAMLTNIWGQSILDRREGVIQRYIGLFELGDTCLDIAFSVELMSRDVAGAIWNRLRLDALDTFIYSEKMDSCEPGRVD